MAEGWIEAAEGDDALILRAGGVVPWIAGHEAARRER